MTNRRFRIAFSFAGEKRDFVATVAELLAERFGEDCILYDKFHEAEFARYDLGIYLPKLYDKQSDLIVLVLCPNYDAKRWTGWEWNHIHGLLTKTDGHRVMPCRFDRAMTDGLGPTAGFIELDGKTPEQTVRLILERLARNEGQSKDYYTKDVVTTRGETSGSSIRPEEGKRTLVPTVPGSKPVIEAINLSAREVLGGGEIEVTVRAKSNAPVNWLNHRLDGPLSCLHGGGGSTNFLEVEPGLWETKWTYGVSPWAPSGTYRFSEISVQNEAELTSDSWGEECFIVRNNQEAIIPEIEYVRLSTDTVTPGGSIEVAVRARSKAPVNWLDRTLDGPTRNLYGGGGTTLFNEVESNVWEHRWIEKISIWAPVGVYTFSKIAVKNEGELSSQPCPNLQFTVEK
ncbi:MAG: TIR domain-containing protein [Cyanobacteria bacterium P01_C01_bin.120]